MCLRIDSWPKGTDDRVVACVKSLHKTDDKFTTPYRATIVPDNGILAPTQEKVQWYDASGFRCGKVGATGVEGGAIHTYKESWERRPGRKECWGDRLYRAYAFGVKAYGCSDMVSSFIYVPAADTSPHRSKRKKLCKEWAKRASVGDPPSWNEINASVLGKDYREGRKW